MKLGDFKKQLSEFDDDRDVVLFSNGYKEVDIVEHEDGIIVCGKGKVCPSVKTAIENNGKDADEKDLCSWGDLSSDDGDTWL